jgi:Flp pilus assembly protein TadB
MSAAGHAAPRSEAHTPRIGAWTGRPGDGRLVIRARLLAPRSFAVRVLLAPARGDGSHRTLGTMRVLAAAGAVLVCLLIAIAAGGPLLLVPALPAALAAAAVPGWALGEAARRGAASAEASLPLALELVAAAMRTGLPLERSLALSAGCVDPSLAAVLAEAVAQAEAGGVLPSQGLAAAAAASGVEDLASVAALIDRRMRLGLPLAPPLLAVADSLRARVRARTLAHAARRGPLAGLVTAVVVAPACALGLLCLVLAGLLADGHLLGLG